MPRVYKPNPNGKRYKKYDDSVIQQAIKEYKTSKKSLKAVAAKYNMNKSVLFRHCTQTMKKQGGQTVFSDETEKHLIKYINICAAWGYPLDSLELRFLIKHYLDKIGTTVYKFKDNLPGNEFVAGFLKRHSDVICQINCQNKKNTVEVSPDSVDSPESNSRELQTSVFSTLTDVEPCNIINYGETKLTDDPGCKTTIVKRGTKHPEKTMNPSKSTISVMMATTATGALLPPYVVYKAQHLYNSWTENGPLGTRYNHSQSGLFDADIFEDWIRSIVLPYFKNNEGKKCLIADKYMSSYLSSELIKLCHEECISFIFLSAKSKRLAKPLDVAFSHRMENAWRNIIEEWKKTNGQTQASLPKIYFPRLLKQLLEKLNERHNVNISTSLKKAGILSTRDSQDSSGILESNTEPNEDAMEKFVLNFLEEMKTINIIDPQRKRRLEIIPRIVSNDTEVYATTDEESLQKRKKKVNIDEITTLRIKVEKGKGKGKKTKRLDQIKNKQHKALINIEKKLALDESHNLDSISNDVEQKNPIVLEDVVYISDEDVANSFDDANAVHFVLRSNKVQASQTSSQHTDDIDRFISKSLERVDCNVHEETIQSAKHTISQIICMPDHIIFEVK